MQIGSRQDEKHAPPTTGGAGELFISRFGLVCALVLIACLALLPAAAAEPDVETIRAELHAAVKDGKTEDESFSRRLEAWYSEFGQTIRIDHPREHTIYTFGLLFATVPDADLPELLRQMPGATDRAGILADYLERDTLATLPFDRQQWLQRPVSGRTRYRMFKSFLAQHPPMGRSQPEIEALLGPADSAHPGTFGYHLGPDLGFAVDTLHVTFSLKDGKVTEYRFYSD